MKVDIQNKKKSLIVLDDNVYATKTRIKEKEIRYHEITKSLNDLKREISAKNENFKKIQTKLDCKNEHNDDLESKVLKFEAAKKELDKISFEKRSMIGNLGSRDSKK